MNTISLKRLKEVVVMLNYKFRIYPTKVQEEKIEKIMQALKSVYNQVLFQTIENYKNGTDKSLKGVKVIDILKLENNQWIIDEKIPKQCFHNMMFYEFSKSTSNYIKKNYKKWKEGTLEFNKKIESGVPYFKKKNDSMSICFSNPTTYIDGKRIRITGIGEIKFVEHRAILGTIKEFRLSKNTTGKYFLAVRTDYIPQSKEELKTISEEQVVGVKLGLNDWLTLSNGKSYQCPDFYRRELDKITVLSEKISTLRDLEHTRYTNLYKKLQKEFPEEDIKLLKKKARLQAESKRRLKLQKELTNIQDKIAERRKHYILNVVNEIYNEYSVVVLPNIYVKELQSVSESRIKDKNINKKFADASLGLVKETFIKIAEREKYICKLAFKNYPYSKTCSKCGVIANDDFIDENDNSFACPSCKIKLNSSLNSAINLKQLFFTNPELLVDKPTEDKSYKKSEKQLAKEKQEQRDKNNPNLKEKENDK